LKASSLIVRWRAAATVGTSALRAKLPGAPAGRGQGKSAVVGEDVEDPFPPGESFHPGAVVALVEKEACLLAADRVDFEAQPVFKAGEGFGDRRPVEDLAVLEAAQMFGVLFQAAVEAQHDAGERLLLQKALEAVVKVGKPGVGVELDHGGVAVAIDDHPRHPVALAVDQPVAVCFGLLQGEAACQSLCYSPGEEGAVDGAGLAGAQDAQADGGKGVVEADGHEALLVVEDDRQIPRFSPVTFTGDAFDVEPGVTPVQTGDGRVADLQLHGLGRGARPVGQEGVKSAGHGGNP